MVDQPGWQRYADGGLVSPHAPGDITQPYGMHRLTSPGMKHAWSCLYAKVCFATTCSAAGFQRCQVSQLCHINSETFESTSLTG